MLKRIKKKVKITSFQRPCIHTHIHTHEFVPVSIFNHLLLLCFRPEGSEEKYFRLQAQTKVQIHFIIFLSFLVQTSVLFRSFIRSSIYSSFSSLDSLSVIPPNRSYNYLGERERERTSPASYLLLSNIEVNKYIDFIFLLLLE